MIAATTEKGFFTGLVLGVTGVFVMLLAGFFQPIFWAAIVGIMFLPVQHFLERRLKGRTSLAAMLTVILIFFTVLVPMFFISSAVISEAAGLYARIQSGQIDPGAALRWLQDLTPWASNLAERLGVDMNDLPQKASALAVQVSQYIGSMALTAGQNVANFMLMFLLMLYLLFFVLRDGDAMLETIIHALPFGDARERLLFAKFAEVSRATIKGTLIIGIVQGAIGGIMFAALGIGGAMLWGVVMVFLAILPLVGASLIWIPAAIFLIVSGAYIKAKIIIVIGSIVIGL